jgi:predicted AAA+ superfamily ATPase
LESSYIIFLLQPHYKQFSRRLIKAPKLYFYDTGLACALLDIDEVDKLKTHYARGNLFESFVISEFFKYRCNQMRRPNSYFWRDSHGHEIDVILEDGQGLTPVEIKMGKTIAADWFDELNYWNELSKSDPTKGFIIYGGQENYRRKTGQIVGWQSLMAVFN